jgi:hypothetical protein
VQGKRNKGQGARGKGQGAIVGILYKYEKTFLISKTNTSKENIFYNY